MSEHRRCGCPEQYKGRDCPACRGTGLVPPVSRDEWEERGREVERRRALAEATQLECNRLAEDVKQAEAEVARLRTELGETRAIWYSPSGTMLLPLPSTIPEDLEARLAKVVEAFQGRGYHAPGKCHHGLTHWCGDHCIFDEPALAAVQAEECRCAMSSRPHVHHPEHGIIDSAAQPEEESR